MIHWQVPLTQWVPGRQAADGGSVLNTQLPPFAEM